MRDVLITALVLGLLPFILRNARLGAYVWVWLAMMVPHRLAYGFARDLPFSLMVGVATLLGFLMSKERQKLPRSPILAIYLAFLFWMTLTSFFALDSYDAIFLRWVDVMKIHVAIFVILMLIRGQEQIERLLWVMTLSLGFYGFKGGIFTILTGGSGRVWGPSGGVIAGNNALGVALVMLMPFMYYLHQRTRHKRVRQGMVAVMVLTFAAILGTQSRGALLSVVAMGIPLALRGKRPVMTTLTIGAVLAGALALMPSSWTDRMETIESFGEDASAMSRIYTWTTLWNLAVDRPLVGAGFNADIPAVFLQYAPAVVGNFDFGGKILVAHSIYFQALGEHGFTGLLLYLLIGISTWLRAGRMAKRLRDHEEFGGWVPLLMRMVQASLIGFAVGGAFLSMVHFDFPYYVVAIVMLVEATVKEKSGDLRRGLRPPTRPQPGAV